jgi:hypothetical protein
MREGHPVAVKFIVAGGHAIFEGDIDLGPSTEIATTEEALRVKAHANQQFGVITTTYGRWPSGNVPYVNQTANSTCGGECSCPCKW